MTSPLLTAIFGALFTQVYSISFFMTAPRTMFRGSSYDATVEILGNISQSADVEMMVMRREYDTFTNEYFVSQAAMANGTFSKNKTGLLTLQIPEDFECEDCQLVVRGSGWLPFESIMPLVVSEFVTAILIQTDKAIYRPGQTVRFRLFAMYSNLTLYDGDFNIFITDPKENKVMEWTGHHSEEGVVIDSLLLGSDILLGMWTLHVNVKDTEDSELQKFQVIDYELPKFNVKIDVAGYGLTGAGIFAGTIKARYTYNEPVSGHVVLHVGENRGPDECGKLPKTTQLTFSIKGEAKFELSLADLQRNIFLMGGTRVKLVAYVTEATTGMTISTTRVITFYDEDYAIQFLEYTPEVFKPGLPLTVFVQVASPDWQPLIGNTENIYVSSVVSYQYTVSDQDLYCATEFYGTYPLEIQNLTLPANGIIPVTIEVPQNATSVCVKATFKGQSASKTITKMISKSNGFLQLMLLGNNIQAGTAAHFMVSGSEPLQSISYVIVARGGIQAFGNVHGSGNLTLEFDLNITSLMTPTARVLIYYIDQEGEIVTDSVTFNIHGMFVNKVSLALSKTSGAPGDNINLTLTADQGSFVNLCAVDQSVLLLRSGNDITVDRIEDSLMNYDFGARPEDYEHSLSNSAASPLEVFQKTGLLVITDLGIESSYHFNHDCGPKVDCNRDEANTLKDTEKTTEGISQTTSNPKPTSNMVFPFDTLMRGLGEMGDKVIDEDDDFFIHIQHIRKMLPDSWLWESHRVEAKGQVTFEATVPDTMTSWVISAFATNYRTGLGVLSNHATLQAFKSFFVVLTGPRSVIQGEELAIQATVFNFLATNVNVTITLKAMTDAQNIFVDKDGLQTFNSTEQKVEILIEAGQEGVVYFPLMMYKAGVVNVEITAQSSIAADTATHQVHVRSAGVPISYNYPFLIFNENPVKNETEVMLPLPDSVVEGSVKYKLKATGDLVGFSLDTLDSLLPLPTGSGEQSVMRFAPSVYIGKYLQATDSLTDDMKKQLVDTITQGYQRQLTYQRFDGSFSDFGEMDSRYSTWLTAFVAQTLAEAREFIYVDPVVLTRAVEWLMDRQEADGSFAEYGDIFDTAIEREDHMGPSLTAFVLLALKQNSNLNNDAECKDDLSSCRLYNRWMQVSSDAFTYLENYKYDNVDMYSLALVSYVLKLYGSDIAPTLMTTLKVLAVKKGRETFWRDSDWQLNSASGYPEGNWAPPGDMARPIDVITTAYALLGHLEYDDVNNSLSIVNWLVQQRNSKGGFVSSQDTVVAMKALTSFAIKYHRPETELKINFTSDNDENVFFNVTTDNALNLQTQLFSEGLIKTAKVEIDGKGLALAEIDVSFNVNASVALPSFEVDVVFMDDNTDHLEILICTKSLEYEVKTTGQVVQEISIPSGFKPHLDKLKKVAKLKRVDEEGSLVSVYFDQMTPTSTCYNLVMTRETKVAQVQKSYIKTFDYYQPESHSIVFYQPKRAAASTICHVCRECCPNTTVFTSSYSSFSSSSSSSSSYSSSSSSSSSSSGTLTVLT